MSVFHSFALCNLARFPRVNGFPRILRQHDLRRRGREEFSVVRTTSRHFVPSHNSFLLEQRHTQKGVDFLSVGIVYIVVSFYTFFGRWNMSKRSDFREKEKKYMPHIVVSSPLPQDDERLSVEKKELTVV